MSKNKLFQQHFVVQNLMETLPPILRNELVNDKVFVERWAIPVEASIGLWQDGPIFERGHLYQSIRAAIETANSPVTLADGEGATWTLVAESRDNGFIFTIKGNGRKVTIADYSALAYDPAIRMGWLKRVTRDVSVENSVVKKWRRRIRGEALDDDEFSELMIDFAITPRNIHRTIWDTLARGSVSIDALVPIDKRYYQRLTGSVTGHTEVAEFIECGIGHLMERLREGDPSQGFLLSLLTCSAGDVSKNIRIDTMGRVEIVEVYRWLVESGDPVSQIGSVEVALSHIGQYPELEPYVEKLVERVITDDPEDGGGIFALLSAIVILVSSELTRTKTLGEVPPFYRRQVAIAQASLIVRAIIGAGVDRKSMTDWATAVGRVEEYYLQGLVDQRVEPRWLPDLATPRQLRAECLGRVFEATIQHGEQIDSPSLRDLLVGRDSRLVRAMEFPSSMLPGVLEGGISPNRSISESDLGDITSRLRAETLKTESFIGLIDAVLVFDLPAHVGQIAVNGIRRVKYSIEDAGNWEEMLNVVKGLAVVASITRNTELATALRIMVRLQRRKERFGGDRHEELVIAMMAAGSYEDREEWAWFAGEWITECAFEMNDRESAARSRAMLRRLIQIEPALARHCAAADAALASMSE